LSSSTPDADLDAPRPVDADLDAPDSDPDAADARMADAAPTFDASFSDICDSIYSGLSSYLLCEAFADECRFVATTSGADSCRTHCEDLGATCLGADDTNAGAPCVVVDTTPNCNTTTFISLLCYCTIP
jgi:hypothetical protein